MTLVDPRKGWSLSGTVWFFPVLLDLRPRAPSSALLGAIGQTPGRPLPNTNL